MAEKASAGNDYRNEGVEGLEEQRWYQDIAGTGVYEFKKETKKGKFLFKKRDILDPEESSKVRVSEKDLSLLIPVEPQKVGGGRRRFTLTPGLAWVRSP
jgi:hypothetical protein